MLRGICAILLPFGVLAVAIGFAWTLTVSHAVDPKLTLLESLLRSVDHQWTAAHHKRAA